MPMGTNRNGSSKGGKKEQRQEKKKVGRIKVTRRTRPRKEGAPIQVEPLVGSRDGTLLRTFNAEERWHLCSDRGLKLQSESLENNPFVELQVTQINNVAAKLDATPAEQQTPAEVWIKGHASPRVRFVLLSQYLKYLIERRGSKRVLPKVDTTDPEQTLQVDQISGGQGEFGLFLRKGGDIILVFLPTEQTPVAALQFDDVLAPGVRLRIGFDRYRLSLMQIDV